jgi:TusE/DsrC/DsvC family sulfur relay protein
MIAGRKIHVDADGFLTDYGEWTERLARQLAEAIGMDLTEEHLAVLRFLRYDFVHLGETPTLRRASAVGGFPIRDLVALFPGKPAKKMAYLAGLPKPRSCI